MAGAIPFPCKLKKREFQLTFIFFSVWSKTPQNFTFLLIGMEKLSMNPVFHLIQF